MVIIDALIW